MRGRAAIAAGVILGIAYLAWVAWLAVGAYGHPPGRSELDRSASELRSVALEATLLDIEAERSRARETYRRSSAWQLGHQVGGVLGSLDPASYPSTLRPRARRLERLARELSAEIGLLEAPTLSRAEEEAVRVRLTRLAEELSSS